MRKILKVALREYKVAVRSKAFLIMLMVLPVLMGGSAVIMKLLENRLDTVDRRIAVVDHTGRDSSRDRRRRPMAQRE